MPRTPRHAPAGYLYHAMNRRVGRMELFHKPEDYRAFERLLLDAHARHPITLLAYCLMPNHWHMILQPATDDQLTAFLRWLTHTHTQRYHAHNHTAGTGHLYQGRFKAFPVQGASHFLKVARYVERNPVRAKLVDRAQDWSFSSLHHRLTNSDVATTILAPWPARRPADWLSLVNTPHTQQELDALRRSVRRSSPFGTSTWQNQTAHDLGLDSTLRSPGRPKKAKMPEKSA